MFSNINLPDNFVKLLQDVHLRKTENELNQKKAGDFFPAFLIRYKFENQSCILSK